MRRFFSLPLLLLVGVPALNLSGFCYSKHRWLSADEMIRAALFNANARGELTITTGDPSKSAPGLYARVPYDSIDEILAHNPDCCQLGPRDFGDGLWNPYTFLGQLLGFGGDVVSLEFTDRFYDADGSVNTTTTRLLYAISNCGDNVT